MGDETNTVSEQVYRNNKHSGTNTVIHSKGPCDATSCLLISIKTIDLGAIWVRFWLQFGSHLVPNSLCRCLWACHWAQDCLEVGLWTILGPILGHVGMLGATFWQAICSIVFDCPYSSKMEAKRIPTSHDFFVWVANRAKVDLMMVSGHPPGNRKSIIERKRLSN